MPLATTDVLNQLLVSLGHLTPSFSWSKDRELEVLTLFRSGRLGYSSVSRCPNDGRPLGGVGLLPDGFWLWQGSHRMSPLRSRHELEVSYLDCFLEEEWSPESFRAAAEYADDELREIPPRLEFVDTVARVVASNLDSPVRLVDGRSPANAHGPAMHRLVSCGSCHRVHLLQPLALVYVALTSKQRDKALHVNVCAPGPPPHSSHGESCAYFFNGSGLGIHGLG